MKKFFNVDAVDGRRVLRSIIILSALLLILACIITYWLYLVYKEDLPSFESLHNIEPSLKTKIYAADGTLLQEFFNENRALVPYNKIPPQMIDMLLAVEDREFFDHWGINIPRTFKAFAIDVVRWRRAQGASTITQQLARMLFLHRQKTVERKIKEALTAIKLERTYSKEEILQMYLNQYYFGRGAYGISAAAKAYFNKSVDELTINDCALLVGLLKAPSRYSDSPEQSLRIRNSSLYSYYDWGKMSRHDYDSLRALPLDLSSPKSESGRAPYFTEMVRQYLLDKYGEDVLYTGGLKVITTLDWDLQQTAETEMKQKLNTMQAYYERVYGINNPNYTNFIPDSTEPGGGHRVFKEIQGASVTIENDNGNVLSLMGGKSFAESKFNRAVQALRQPGSSFKPFVYTAAIDNGYHPSDIFYDDPIVLTIPGAKEWRPQNFDNEFMGEMTLRDGLRLSRNLIAIKLLLKLNPDQVIFYANKMGITTPLQPVASLAIGTSEVRLIDITSAYTVFPNGGIKVPYRYILKIIDRYGNVMEDNTNIHKEEVLSAQTAYIMVNMLQSVVDNGTGRGARTLGFMRPAGGKTGTSDNFTDNWFVGFTPQITTGVWVGFDDKTSIGKNQTGSANALPIWTAIMMKAHSTLPTQDFSVPDGITFADICLNSGKLATDRCIDVRREVFKIGDVPTETCPVHPSKKLYVGPSNIDRFNIPEDSADVYHF
ncbi:Penicillin-binding protein, 1A family [Candidatus Zixiibacteriota bacterium]|nr:Penicillin-binding protein, 1A family [candidate division Zixibacteria bacterium]